MYRTLAAALLCALFAARSLRRVSPRRSFNQLDTQLQANRERYGIAGQAVLVAHNGQVLYQGASGERDRATHTPAAVDSIFAAQSMAKLLTSTLVMQLVDRGKVDLDARPAVMFRTCRLHGRRSTCVISSTTARVSASTTTGWITAG